MAKESKAVTVTAGLVKVKILHETYVPAVKGGHQKVLAGAIVDVPELDANHLIAIGKAEAVAG